MSLLRGLRAQRDLYYQEELHELAARHPMFHSTINIVSSRSGMDRSDRSRHRIGAGACQDSGHPRGVPLRKRGYDQGRDGLSSLERPLPNLSREVVRRRESRVMTFPFMSW